MHHGSRSSYHHDYHYHYHYHYHYQAFCNACTTNNHNSSRFGKFVRLLVEPDGPVAGAAIDAYLLEKSRLVAQCDGE